MVTIGRAGVSGICAAPAVPIVLVGQLLLDAFERRARVQSCHRDESWRGGAECGQPSGKVGRVSDAEAGPATPQGRLEPAWNLPGTCLEPAWNPSGTLLNKKTCTV